jgi:hypothetical protein
VTEIEDAALKELDGTLILSNIVSKHRGKGVFEFKPLASKRYFLEITLANKDVKKIEVKNNLDEGVSAKAEIYFQIDNVNKAVIPGEDLEVTFRSNNYPATNTYLYVVKEKERNLYVGVLTIDANMEEKRFIPSKYFNKLNGGVFTLALMKLSNEIQIDLLGKDYAKILDPNSLSSTWFTNKGEVLFFKVFDMNVKLEITTEEALYTPGSEVNFSVKVLDKETDSIYRKDDFYMTITVTDDSVFDKLEQAISSPPSIGTNVLLVHELNLKNYELRYASEYIDALYE